MIDPDKKEIIDKLIDAIQCEADFIRNSDTLPETKVSQVDVLLDVYHFLRDYEKNVQILNEYYANHKFDRER